MTPVSRHLALAPLVLAALLAACSPQTKEQPAPLPEPLRGVNLTGSPKYGKDFSLPDADGKERSLADFKGKAVLLYFGFVQCPDICPTSLLRAAEVKKMLGKDGERLQVIFVTVDPERDTPEVLRAYMNAFDPSFIALRGSSEQLAKVAEDFKVYYRKVPTGSSYTMDHTAHSYVFDPQGRLRLALRHEQTPQDYAHDISLLLKAPH